MRFMKIAGFLAAAASVMMIGAGAAMAETEGGEPLSICIITSSGVDDGSFNQDCYVGIQDFLKERLRLASFPKTLSEDVSEKPKLVPEPCQNGTSSACWRRVYSSWKVLDWRKMSAAARKSECMITC